MEDIFYLVRVTLRDFWRKIKIMRASKKGLFVKIGSVYYIVMDKRNVGLMEYRPFDFFLARDERWIVNSINNKIVGISVSYSEEKITELGRIIHISVKEVVGIDPERANWF